MQQEIKSKISNPERIARILMKMCDGGMYALIRPELHSKVGIRSNFHMVETSSNPMQLYFSGISSYGLEKLSSGVTVKFEVIGMPSKVIFQTKIIKKLGIGGIICDLPRSLLSIERRSATRAATTNSLMGYMSLGVWHPEIINIDTPPVFDHFMEIYNWISIMDISIGGVCLKTHFPSVLNYIHGLEQDRNAHLILPMQDPIVIPIAFRWQKRIKNRLVSNNKERYQLDFRIGVEFLHLTEAQMLKIKHFIRQLSVANAI